jgi:hypothetical protein
MFPASDLGGERTAMAKYRCPSCGAAHKEEPGACRLCGYVMDGSVAIPTQSSVGRAVAPPKKKGTASLIVIGLVIVAVLVVGAVVLNVSAGSSSVTKVVAKLPGTKTEADGWKQVNDSEGGFTVLMPPNSTTTSVAFAPSVNGQLTGWLGSIGEAPSYDTQIYVVHGKVTPSPGETSEDTITRMGDTKVAQDGYVVSRNHTNYQGYPAIQYTINRVPFSGQDGYENAMMFMKGDVLYVVETVSIYPGAPATTDFDRVLNSLTFT